MKKLLENKYVLIGLALTVGLAIGWIISPSSSESKDSSHEHDLASENQTWTCSMHPQIRQSEPGSCPICGMDLILLKSDINNELDPAAIRMSENAMLLASVSTAKVEASKTTKRLKLNGKVQADERKVYAQASHIAGRVEELKVNFTGEYVKKGQTLARIYSPELVTAQEELLEAQKIKDSQPALFEAAKEKLRKWKLSDLQINQILRDGIITEHLAITADESGYVMNKMVQLGDYVKKGAIIYELVDLSDVWILFDVYESDIAWIAKGDAIEFTVRSLPGEVLKGNITYIDPVIDSKTRVAKARVVVPNTDLKLKPEMFVSGTVNADIANSKSDLSVPKTAVMWTGERSVVYVKTTTDQGVYFRMREVTLGSSLGESYLIKEGLSDGEEIAVNGAFSIDAAAQLAGKPSMMNKDAGMDENIKAGSPKTHDLTVNESTEIFTVSDLFKKQLQQVFEAYLPVKNALVSSDPDLAQTKAKALIAELSKVDMKLLKGAAHMAWMMDLEVLQKSSGMVASQPNLDHQRKMLMSLSDQLYHSLKKFQVHVTGFRQFCPMANENGGAFWLSGKEEIRNPYFGDQMLTCGNVEEQLN
ncbi:MAG: Cu(I)/Ag(I) efflux system membrane fusion protein [Marinoscillum sp.]|jgi:Cu(I)/Ag(I) efflux system membrane fusion protein